MSAVRQLFVAISAAAQEFLYALTDGDEGGR
jgi:hypothetical protein